MDEEKKDANNFFGIYDRISSDLIEKLRQFGVNPNEVALDAGMTSERMLELLFNSQNGDYLAYREINTSIKKLVKIKEDGMNSVAKK